MFNTAAANAHSSSRLMLAHNTHCCPMYKALPPPPPRPQYDPAVGLRHPRAVEIIQLVEVPAPMRAPRPHRSLPASTPASTSYCSSSSESEESESAESYCSSDVPSLRHDAPGHRSSESEDEPEPARWDDTFHQRMRRIENWRDHYAKSVGAEFGEQPPLSLCLGARA